jgi:tetratricopeptide (TPR) repeat protein
MRSYADAVRCLARSSVPAVAAMALMGATQTWSGEQDEIDEFLRKEDRFSKFREQDPSPEAAAPAVPVAPPASSDELEKVLAARTRELESARQEVARLKDVIRRIWDASKQDRLNSHYNTGCVYRAFGQFKTAESEFLKALKLDPNDPGVNYNLGILYDDDLKDKSKARTYYQRFLELAPDDKDAPRVREWLLTLQ